MENIFFESFAGIPEVKHLITSRDRGEPADFSLAYHTGEDAAYVRDNRSKIEAFFGDDVRFVSALQVHGDDVCTVDTHKHRGWSELDRTLQSDALVTNKPNIALTILTADCVPILLYDPVNSAIGAVHAGWQGSHLGIVSKTIEKMGDLYGSDPSDIIAGIGPSIGGCCYEVGAEVAKHFISYNGAVVPAGNEKYLLDLKRVNSMQLRQSGLLKENIEISPYCTSCDNDKFFSYRKEGGTRGRFMSIIAISA